MSECGLSEYIEMLGNPDHRAAKEYHDLKMKLHDANNRITVSEGHLIFRAQDIEALKKSNAELQQQLECLQGERKGHVLVPANGVGDLAHEVETLIAIGETGAAALVADEVRERLDKALQAAQEGE